MDDPTIKHLELIQAVVTRLAQNSFSYKGWAVTLVAAILALGAAANRPLYFLVALVPIIVFWGLDAYYLRQERLFRKLYDAVRTSAPAGAPREMFSMHTSPYASEVATWWGTCWSKTIAWLYGPMAIVVVAAALVAALL